jgi:restriction system protein
LRYAGLLENEGRGKYKLSVRGRETLAAGIDKLTKKSLYQYAEFRRFMGQDDTGEAESKSQDDQTRNEPAVSPEELLEQTSKTLRSLLATELLDKVKSSSPRYFEQIVVDLLVAMGYGGSHAEAGQKTRYTADGGVDGIIKEDKLGLDSIYLQAKRWEATVGRPTVQAFAGSLEGFRARKGVLITTSQFSSDAREYVDRIEKKIVLIDGEQLAELMIDHNVGVTVQNTYVLKRVDGDYFEEE